MENPEKKIRYVPMLSQIEESAGELPDPVEFGEDAFAAKIRGTDREVVFERLQVYRSDKTKTYKWTYKGRLFVDTKFINKAESNA